MLQTVGNTYGNFSLATMFPRREFTKEDYKKKLLDLELAPSASVVLLPVCICMYIVFLLLSIFSFTLDCTRPDHFFKLEEGQRCIVGS